MKKIFIFAGMLCASVSMYAQSVKISGTVTDEMGPVMGASVMVKGTKTGTVTDINGRYTINADKNAVLVFSYVGTNPVEKTVTGSVLDAYLSSNVQSINEVVVTAIGIKQEKKKLGYTTQQVEGAEIAAAGKTDEYLKVLSYWSGLSETRKPFVYGRDEILDSWHTLLEAKLIAAMMNSDPAERYAKMKSLSQWVSGSISYSPGTLGGFKPDGTSFQNGTKLLLLE